MLLLVAAAIAQSYPARTFGEADGLPHQSILGIAQTKDGLLWFATMAGLAHYDGQVFESVPVAKTDGGRPDYFRIATDADGALHAFENRMPFPGYRQQGGEWQPLPPMTLALSPPGAPNPRLMDCGVINRGGKQFALLGTDQGHLLHLADGKWRVVPTGSDCVHNICIADDRFLVGHTGGLGTLPIEDPNAQLQTVAEEIPAKNLMAIAWDDQRHSCWLVGRTWIGEYRGGKFVLRLAEMADPFFPDIIHVGLLPDEHGGIYFGERIGTLHFSPETGLQRFQRPCALDQIGVTRMFRDREGIIWGGGVRGVAKFAGRSIANRTSHHGLTEDEVSAVLQLRDGRMVFGHTFSLTIMDEDQTRPVRVGDQGTATRIMSMVQANDGSILAAATRAGLLRIDPDTGAVTPLESPVPLPAGVKPTDIERLQSAQSVDINEQGDVAVASWQSIWLLRDSGREVVDVHDALPTNTYFRQVVWDDADLLAAVRNMGVALIGKDGVETWTGNSPLAKNVTCVQRRPDDTIWVGSHAGLLQTTADGSLRHVDFGSNQITCPVYFITNDHNGRTWIGTNNGVVVWDGRRLRHFRDTAGLAGTETNRGAGYCDKDGHMWVGLDRGVTTFHLDREAPIRVGPSVSFLGPQIDGRNRATDDWASVDDSSTVTFRLRSISTRDEEDLLHSYWLEGLEGSWTTPAPLPGRQIVYRSLPAGEYRLHVRVTDSVGMTSEAVSPVLTVLPPWWRRFWFVAVATLVGLLLVAGIAAFANQRRDTRRLQLAVDEQTADLIMGHSRLHAMLTSIADGVIGTDDDGSIIVWNPTAARLTGWQPEQAIGLKLAERIPEFDSAETGRPVKVTGAFGNERWFEFTTATVGNKSDKSRLIAFRDVTERREQERLLTRTERLESLGILAGGIAHDFNNLLTVVLGNLSILEFDRNEDAGSAADYEVLHGQIRDAVLRARDLTQQLLTFSKGGAPVRQLGPLTAVIQESTQLALSGANVRSSIEIDDDLHEVEFDLGQISQVIHNLVLNARQAMPEGGEITVRGYNADSLHEGRMAACAVIEVRDEGPGIAPTELELIFDPYYSTKPQGTGLGLATSHSIVKRHDGFLTAESQVGVGSIFRVHLPSPTRSSRTRDGHSAAHAGETMATMLPIRILCMDDDPAIRAVLQATMQLLGHTTTLVADGDQAIEAFRTAQERGQPFDAVLLDMTVPGGMGGIETMKHLSRMHPGIPAIATTGYSTEPVEAEFKEHGFAAMLGKPFGVADVRNAILVAKGSQPGQSRGA